MIQSEQIVFSDTFAYHVYSGRGEDHKVVENICSKVVGSRFIGFPSPER